MILDNCGFSCITTVDIMTGTPSPEMPSTSGLGANDSSRPKVDRSSPTPPPPPSSESAPGSPPAKKPKLNTSKLRRKDYQFSIGEGTIEFATLITGVSEGASAARPYVQSLFP